MLNLNYTYRIYPSIKQEKKLTEWLEICRSSYNYALRELKDWLASRKCQIDRCSLESEYIMPADYPFPGYHQQQNNLPKAKKKYYRLATVPAQVLQTNIRRLHDAWDFFKTRGFGFPRFKRYGQLKSILFPQFRTSPLIENHIKLPKLGLIDIKLHRPIPNGFKIKQIRVVKKAIGWFATLSIQLDVDVPKPIPYGHAIGVDLGLEKYLSTSDGFIEKGCKFFSKLQSRLKVLQRRLSKKKKLRTRGEGTSPTGRTKQRHKNYEKARLKVERMHNHIVWARKDYQFKLAHKLCDMADTIFLEDIDFRSMAKGFLGKHTLDAAFGQFRTILKYVAWARGKYVAEVDHRGTSQTCPNCRIEVRKELKDRWHSCPECRYEVDRDVASAQEICNRGLEMLCTQGLWGKEEIGYQVGLSGAMCIDKWRRVAMPSCEVGKPTP